MSALTDDNALAGCS